MSLDDKLLLACRLGSTIADFLREHSMDPVVAQAVLLFLAQGSPPGLNAEARVLMERLNELMAQARAKAKA